MCTRWCWLEAPERPKGLPHSLHTNGFSSPVDTLVVNELEMPLKALGTGCTCRASLLCSVVLNEVELLLKALPHTSQE